MWNFETIRESLMKPKWQKLASLAQEICTVGDWDCVAAVERLPALHYSVDFIIFLKKS